MGLMWMAAWAAALKDRQEYYYPNKKSRQEYVPTIHSYGKEYPKMDYINCVMEETRCPDSKLGAFFGKIEDGYKDYLQEQIDEEKKKIKEPEDKIDKDNKRIEEIINKYKEKGFDIKDCIKIIKVYDRGIHSAPDSILTRYLQQYCLLRQDHIDEYTRQINESQKKIKKEKRKLLYQITDSKRMERKMNITNCNESINQATKMKEIEENKIENVKVFLNMDSEAKKDVAELFDLTHDIYKQERKTWEVNDQIEKIRNKVWYLDTSIIPIVLERMCKEGKITDCDLKKAFLLLDKVEINARRGKYKCFISSETGLYPSIVKWFIRNIYETDEDFIRRNYQLLEKGLQEEPEEDIQDPKKLIKK